MPPACSVIIPTYRRPDKLSRALQALTKQTEKNFEVIVASDGPAGASLSVARQFHSNFPSLRICERPHGGRAAIRNFGAGEAVSDLLIFIDDDMRPTPDCIASHLAHHASQSDSILGGNQLEDLSLVQTDFQAYKALLSRQWTRDFPSDRPLPKVSVFLTAAHFSIPRRTFQILKGFDERLTDCEDFEFAARAHLTGIPIFFHKELIAWHDDFPTCRSYISRKRQWSKARKVVFELNADLRALFPERQSPRPNAIKKNFFRLLAQNRIVSAIDAERSILLIPKPIRFKIYEYVVAALGNYFVDIPLSDV